MSRHGNAGTANFDALGNEYISARASSSFSRLHTSMREATQPAIKRSRRIVIPVTYTTREMKNTGQYPFYCHDVSNFISYHQITDTTGITWFRDIIFSDAHYIEARFQAEWNNYFTLIIFLFTSAPHWIDRFIFDLFRTNFWLTSFYRTLTIYWFYSSVCYKAFSRTRLILYYFIYHCLRLMMGYSATTKMPEFHHARHTWPATMTFRSYLFWILLIIIAPRRQHDEHYIYLDFASRKIIMLTQALGRFLEYVKSIFLISLEKLVDEKHERWKVRKLPCQPIFFHRPERYTDD